MSTKAIVQFVIVLFVIALLGMIIFYQYTNSQQKQQPQLIVNSQEENSRDEVIVEEKTSVDRVQQLEEKIINLQDQIDDQNKELDKITNNSSQQLSTKQILNTALAQGSSFSTSSSAYTPMGLFTNITCPTKCTLWINFYANSKNNSTNTINTYGLFVNGENQGIYSQATIQNGNSVQTVSLNSAKQLNAGTHTVEIQAKTSGGILESDISSLQVIAIE